jgi:hypothetical protein
MVEKFAACVVDTVAVVHLELLIFPRIFEKIRNGLNGILWAGEKRIQEKKPKAKNLVTLSL